MVDDQDIKYWVAISQIPRFGAVRFKKLYSYFPDLQTLWQTAQLPDLLAAGIEPDLAEDFFSRKRDINPDQYWQEMLDSGISAINIFDPDYSKLLKEIYAPPAVLFYKGNLKSLNEYSIAVVGTRKLSHYGRQITTELVRDLAQNKILIVSGLALGIDSEAHLAALDNQTNTVAVIGSGLDTKSLYPGTNRNLAEKIVSAGGVVMSEYPIGTMPLKQNFPMRNRIIAGLSLATVVVEAGEVSGALITALYALEQNREVFAVPGNITSSNSGGTNRLIRDGARVVLSAADILDVLNLRQTAAFTSARQTIPDNFNEAKVLEHLSREPIHIDQLAQATGLPSATLNSTLTLMELKGKVRNLGNMNFVTS